MRVEPHDGINTLKTDRRDHFLALPSAMWGHSKKIAILKQEAALTRPDLQTP